MEEVSPLSSYAQTLSQVSIHHKDMLTSFNANTYCKELELVLIEITYTVWSAKIFVYL